MEISYQKKIPSIIIRRHEPIKTSDRRATLTMGGFKGRHKGLILFSFFFDNERHRRVSRSSLCALYGWDAACAADRIDFFRTEIQAKLIYNNLLF